MSTPMNSEMSAHRRAEPSTLYFGTPVILISTVNEDGSYNLAPMSSIFWLGWRCVFGINATSKTTENLLRTRECVVNLPSSDQVHAVDRLALTTGSDPVPENKRVRGYFTARDKFERAGLTPVPSETVAAPRALECPVHIETKIEHWRGLAENDEKVRGRVLIFEGRVQRVHLAEDILKRDNPNHVDTDRWRPLIMIFSRYYGLADGELRASTLAQIPDHLYRSPDIESARAVPARA